jgi:MoaA/NifB/PqqE/SkfB family radical SAM enzyme
MKSRIGPNGIHFFDRLSGLNVLMDELRPEKTLWSRSPRQVSVALTNLCDLHCSYCYAPKHKAALYDHQVINWLKELDSQGCLGVGFGGGEPTLHPDFTEICKKVTGETRLAVTFTTHGHRLTPLLIKRLKGAVHFTRISVDGIGRTYEEQRGKSFTNLVRSLESTATLSPFGLNVVVNERTVDELDALSELAHEVGASELLLLPQQATSAVSAMNGQSSEKLHRWVAAYQGKVRLAVSEAGAYGLPTCDPHPDERGLHSYAHIDASGILRASSYSSSGQKIDNAGILAALEQLRATTELQGES